MLWSGGGKPTDSQKAAMDTDETQPLPTREEVVAALEEEINSEEGRMNLESQPRNDHFFYFEGLPAKPLPPPPETATHESTEPEVSEVWYFTNPFFL